MFWPYCVNISNCNLRMALLVRGHLSVVLILYTWQCEDGTGSSQWDQLIIVWMAQGWVLPRRAIWFPFQACQPRRALAKTTFTNQFIPLLFWFSLAVLANALVISSLTSASAKCGQRPKNGILGTQNDNVQTRLLIWATCQSCLSTLFKYSNESEMKNNAMNQMCHQSAWMRSYWNMNVPLSFSVHTHASFFHRLTAGAHAANGVMLSF